MERGLFEEGTGTDDAIHKPVFRPHQLSSNFETERLLNWVRRQLREERGRDDERLRGVGRGGRWLQGSGTGDAIGPSQPLRHTVVINFGTGRRWGAKSGPTAREEEERNDHKRVRGRGLQETGTDHAKHQVRVWAAPSSTTSGTGRRVGGGGVKLGQTAREEADRDMSSRET